MTRKCIISLMCLFLGVVLCAEAEPLEQEFVLRPGINIRLPKGWHQISEELLERMSRGMTRVEASYKVDPYQFGFQLGEQKNALSYPYILLQIQRTGKISQSDLGKIKKIDEQMKKAGQHFEREFETLVSSISSGETVYEKENHILWSSFSGELAGVGEVRSLTGSLLTQEGAIHIHCYAKAEDFSTYSSQFEAIVRQTRLASDLRYQP